MRVLRKIFRYGSFLFLLLLITFTLALFTLQWWIPNVVPTLVRWGGATLDSAAYLGKGQLLLTGLRYKQDNVDFHAKQIEILLPTWWLWKGWQEQLDPYLVLKINSWELTLPAGESSDSADSGLVVPDLPGYVYQGEQYWITARRWLPNVQITHGVLNLGTQQFYLHELKKTGKQLELHAELPNQQWLPQLSSSLSLQAILDTSASDQAIRLHWQIPEEKLSGNLQLSLNDDQDRLFAVGYIVIPQGRATFDATWASGSWTPLSANFQTDQLQLDPSHLAERAPRGDISILLSANWQEGQYNFNLDLQLDLAQQAFFEAQGSVDAHISLSGTSMDNFNGTFSLNGKGIQYQDTQIDQAILTGSFSPESMQLSPSEVLFSQGYLLHLDRLNLLFTDNARQEADFATRLQINDHLLVATTGRLVYVQPNDQQTSGQILTQLQTSLTRDGHNSGDLILAVEVDPSTFSYGKIEANGTFTDFSWLQDLPVGLPDISGLSIHTLQADLHWQDGPLIGTLDWDIDYNIPDTGILNSLGKLQLTEKTASAPEILIALREDEIHPLLRIALELPVSIYPARKESPLEWRRQDPWNVSAKMIAEDSWLQRKLEPLPITISNPKLELSLHGTPDAPYGNLRAISPKLILVHEDYPQDIPAPEIRDLNLEIELTPENIHLLPTRLIVMNNPVQAEANLPWTNGDLLAFLENQTAPDLKTLSANLQMNEFPLESIAAILPEFLRPQGTLSIQLNKESGELPTGQIIINKLNTYPLGTLGSLEGIEANITINKETLRIGDGQIWIGGVPVTFSGTSQLPDLFDYTPDQLPLFRVEIKGENVPFIRSPGLILRSDLDLFVTNENQPIPVVGGSLQLQDSISLADITQFEFNPQSPSQRPPYFSVDTPLLKDWRLNLQIAGSRFLRIRSPILDGTLSTQLSLIGTLNEPQLVGNATLHNASIKFPFARFRVNQGTITLDRANPYDARLGIYASTQTLGYNLQLELNGYASDPRLTFASTPPLDSSQILLLVSTGQPPAGEVNRSTRNRLSTIGLYLSSGLFGSGDDEDGFLSRISMESGRRVSEQGKETMEVQYRISDKWYLIGEYDEFDAYNMDVKWKLFTR